MNETIIEDMVRMNVADGTLSVIAEQNGNDRWDIYLNHNLNRDEFLELQKDFIIYEIGGLSGRPELTHGDYPTFLIVGLIR